MKCPRCNNTKTFKHYMIAEIEATIDYNKDGEAEDRDSGEECISGTTTMKCAKCQLICLPEVFGNVGPAGWPKPHRDGYNGWYIVQDTEVECYGLTIRGRAYLDTDVGEFYSEMYRLHVCDSLAELPSFLASGMPGIKDLAVKKMKELQC